MSKLYPAVPNMLGLNLLFKDGVESIRISSPGEMKETCVELRYQHTLLGSFLDLGTENEI